MHPQLEAIATEYASALERLHRLRDATPADRWGVRCDPDRWSVAECVAHLNLTSEAFLPVLREALERAPRSVGPAASTSPRRYRRDFVGWLLWRSSGPPVRLRVKTAAAFVPQGELPAETLVADFERLQNAQLDLLRAADGLPLGQIRITSPFDARVRYNLYSAFTILPRHQHRHLWQAEQVWVSSPSGLSG